MSYISFEQSIAARLFYDRWCRVIKDDLVSFVKTISAVYIKKSNVNKIAYDTPERIADGRG